MTLYSYSTLNVLGPVKLVCVNLHGWVASVVNQAMNCAYTWGVYVITASLYSKPGISTLWRKQSPFLNNKIYF